MYDQEIRDSGGGIELRESESGPSRIVGYAARFYDPKDAGTEFRLGPRLVERIMPNAFDGHAEDDVLAVFNHDENMLLGRSTSGTLKLSVDARGLRYEIVPSNDPDYLRVLGKIERGDVTGSSFRFSVKEKGERFVRAEDGMEVRELHSLNLHDVCPVTTPAYGAATSEAASLSARSRYSAWEAAQKDAEARAAERARQVRLVRLGDCA